MKQKILNRYCELTKKLGKFPSYREVVKLVVSRREMEKHFGKLNALKAEAIELYPDLEFLGAPSVLTVEDVDKFRTDLIKKTTVATNKLLVKSVSQLDYIKNFSEEVFKGRLTGTIYKSSKPTKRVINVVLSDLHIGADINGEETGQSTFGHIEEARRLAKVVEQVCSYKLEYRKETELNVLLLGDIIQGMLKHDPRDGAELAEQFCRAVHLLGQALGRFCGEFKKVTVYCTTGNHDRNISRHEGRAIHGRYDSFFTMLAYSLKSMMSSYPNISFEIPLTPYVKIKALNYNIYGWHGDSGIKTGYVGTSINVKSISNAINDINASLSEDEKYSAFVCGHLHVGSITHLSNGAVLLVNGGLPPVDAFSLSLGSHSSSSGQLMFESVQDYPVGDVRFIRVDKKTDLNSRYDMIIKPWEKL